MPVSPDFKLEVLSIVRNIGEAFEDPDDDWMPVFVVPGCVCPLEFHNEVEKDILAEVLLPAVVAKQRAKEYAFVSSAWMTSIKPPEELRDKPISEQMAYFAANYPPPSMSAQRRECVMVSFGCSDGTNEGWIAEIKRSEKDPPELGEWENSAGDMDGRFVDSLMEAVKANA